jgi:hypothetical protein
VAVIGAALLIAAFRRRALLEIRLIAIGSAIGLAAIDVIYVSLARIPPVYLLDALGEIGLAAWWVMEWRHKALLHAEARVDTPQIDGDIVGRAYKVGGGHTNIGGEP